MATAQSKRSFLKAASSLMNDAKFSDFTIACEGRDFKVHRCIIASHSLYFERCCAGSFVEAQQARIDLKEDYSEVVERMIAFFYTFDYDDTIATDPPLHFRSKRPRSRMQMNAHVYAIAEKYQIDNLKALALEKFTNHATITDREQMLCATWTVWRNIELPDDDWALKDLLLNMWLMGGPDLFKDGKAGEALNEFAAELPEFMALIFYTVTYGHKGGTVKLTCKKCKKQETVPRSKALGFSFICKGQECGCVETEDSVMLNGPVRVGKFW